VNIRRIIRCVLAFGLVWVFLGQEVACAADANALIAQAKELLKADKAADAYDLLEKDADANAANVEYSYLLGIAALDSGKPGIAVFAFERALAINPQHLPARAELARAYLALGESEAAKEELAEVRKLNPPPEVAKTVGDFLKDIDIYERQRQAAASTSKGWSGYIQMDNGFDTNVNTATNALVVNVPLFGNLPLQLSTSQAQLFTAQSSAFTGLGMGANFLGKISESVSFFAGADVSGKYNWRVENFYTYSLGAATGVRVDRGSNSFTAGINTHQYFVDTFHQDDYRGGFLEWQRLLDQNNKLTLFAQYFDADHPFANQLATNLWLGGGSWAHAFEAKGSPGLLSLTAYGADDHQKNDDPSVGRKFYGGRASVQYDIKEGIKLLGGAGIEKSNYNGVNVFFNNKRGDLRQDYNVGLAYTPAKQWTITPQFAYTRNESNVAFSDYNRKLAYVSVRRAF
jgi:tetratricopeptide (TPR) repeat protein